MRYTTIDELDRRIRTQELVCMLNGWLLEHYEKQKEALKRAEAGQPKKDKREGVPAYQTWTPSKHPQDKECDHILP
jgi:hypothetical protein